MSTNHREQPAEARRCALCGREGARLGTTTWETGRSGVEIRVSGVPAVLCDACEDDAIDGPLAVELSDAMESIIQAVERYNAARAGGSPARTR